MATGAARKRTAVLFVHGMGSQRPLESVRGVVESVWLEGDTSAHGARRIWMHPERSGVDIDLPVITTNFVPGTDHRRIDFHELYWAHLMSETRGVAVLLWLFDLARKGPRLKPSMAPLWWGAAIFLAFLILSVSFLAIQGIERFANIADDRQSMFIAPFLIVSIVAAISAGVALVNGARTLAIWAFVVALVAAAALVVRVHWLDQGTAESIATSFLPITVAIIAVAFVMGRWGLAALAIAYLLSFIFLAVQSLWFGGMEQLWRWEGLPWSLTSKFSAVAAWLFVGAYFVIYAAFLRSYLGDAARYFRNAPANVLVRRETRKQAVDTLEALHLSGDYDRIVVVAHSLGTVVAYDMLRAYYSRINPDLPSPDLLGPDFADVDQGNLSKSEARSKGREIIRAMAAIVDEATRSNAADSTPVSQKRTRAWLVTDFITMGSPLTHARYLMCRGNTEEELHADFTRRTREREFPMCPPLSLDDNYRLTFENPNDHVRYFHEAGQFALTRWTNLYFPASQVFWGDAIGGPVKDIFGDNVADVPVYLNPAGKASFFAHTQYWMWPAGSKKPLPHIEALQRAIDVADRGAADGL